MSSCPKYRIDPAGVCTLVNNLTIPLHEQGWTLSAIAQHVGLDRNTVRRYVTAPAFPERHARPLRASVLDPYKPYILKRWNEGCHTGAEIWRELEQQGAACQASTVFSYISRLRQAQGLPPKKRVVTTEGEVVSAERGVPRRAVWRGWCSAGRSSRMLPSSSGSPTSVGLLRSWMRRSA